MKTPSHELSLLRFGDNTVFINTESGAWLHATGEKSTQIESFLLAPQAVEVKLPQLSPALRQSLYRSRIIPEFSQKKDKVELAENGRVKLVIIEVSQLCNLACTYCFEDNPTRGKLMSHDSAQKVVQEILRLPLSEKVVIEFNGGEAFLNFNAIETIILGVKQAISKKQVKANPVFTVQTSGTVLPERAIKFLKENNMAIGISLDGQEEIHNSRRPLASGKGSYSAIAKNIDRLKREGVAFGLLAIVDTATQLKEAYYHLRTLSPNALRINLQRMNGRSTSHISDEELRNLADAHIECFVHDLNMAKLGEPVMRLADICSLIENICLEEKPYMCQRSPCGAGTDQVVFDWATNVWPCQEFIGEGKFSASIQHFHESIIDFHERDELSPSGVGKNALQLISETPSQEHFLSRSTAEISGCRDCTYRHYCQSGCPATAWYSVADATKRTMKVRTPHCQYYFQIIPKLFQLITERPNEVFQYVFAPERGYSVAQNGAQQIAAADV